MEHKKGNIKALIFIDGTKRKVPVIFTRPALKQQCDIPAEMGCEFTERGLLRIDEHNKTTIPGVFAAGDNATMFRAISLASASGTNAGAFLNKELIDEGF